MANGPALALVKPHKTTHTKSDTVLITAELLKTWLKPDFQRPIRINEQVKLVAQQIKSDGVIPGVLTLGVLDRKTYVLDGQHRIEAYKMAEIQEAFADVRIHYVESMAAMGDEFVRLNSALVRMRPDDKLRALEGSLEAVALIRKRCPFVGYDFIRRGSHSPILSMSQVIRSWTAALPEVPTPAGGGSATEMATRLTKEEAERCSDFLLLAFEAWGRDSEYQRVWGTLNLTVCMWLYRRIVVAAYSSKSARVDKGGFGRLLMSLTADKQYMYWLVGRMLNDRDRAPCYNRVKAIFARRLIEETGKKAMFPSPDWAHGGGRT